MKFYLLSTEFTFGKFKGKKVEEILHLEPLYLEWCAINLSHFYMSEGVLKVIKHLRPDFNISDVAKKKMDEKYAHWKLQEKPKKEDDDFELRPQSYESWLRDEFGDDAGIAYWNTH